MFYHQGGLCEREKNRKSDHADLAVAPDLGAHMAPDDLVQKHQEEEEQGPAQGQLAPARIVQFERHVHDDLEEQPVEQEPAQKNNAECAVDERRLHLEECFVLEIERQSTA